MTFATEMRNELARIKPERKCCMLAEISGFIRVSGSIGLAGGGKFRIVTTTENPAVARHFKMLVKEYFNIEISIEVGQHSTFKKNKYYKMTIGPENLSEQILRETGILMIREGMNFISDGILSAIIKKKCCKKAYLRGIFLGSGSITNPAKDYHFEIGCATETLAKDLMKLINSFYDLEARMIKRKNEWIVYVKKSEQIVDLLAIMGASSKIFEYEDIRIKKEIRNKANRINNCDQANIDKALRASQRHIKSINQIEKSIGIDALPEKLREVAKLRIAHPDLSLKELGELMVPPMQKSGINKRLSKIEEIAREQCLKEESEQSLQ